MESNLRISKGMCFLVMFYIVVSSVYVPALYLSNTNGWSYVSESFAYSSIAILLLILISSILFAAHLPKSASKNQKQELTPKMVFDEVFKGVTEFHKAWIYLMVFATLALVMAFILLLISPETMLMDSDFTGNPIEIMTYPAFPLLNSIVLVIGLRILVFMTKPVKSKSVEEPLAE